VARGRPPSGQPLTRPRAQSAKNTEYVTVISTNELMGPELPDHPWGQWHVRTVTWWESWRRSPMAQTFIAIDWDFLIDTALLHSLMWEGQLNLGCEVRLRVEKMGATARDRDRIRVLITGPDHQKAEPHSDLVARRERLRHLVTEE